GRDSLHLTGSTAVDAATYTPGPNPDEGQIEHDDFDNEISQFVFFTGLEPIVDTVRATDATVNGTNADNAINYTGPGPNSVSQLNVNGIATIQPSFSSPGAPGTYFNVPLLGGSGSAATVDFLVDDVGNYFFSTNPITVNNPGSG